MMYLVYYNKKVFGPYDNKPTNEDINSIKEIFDSVKDSLPDQDHIFENGAPPDGAPYIIEKRG